MLYYILLTENWTGWIFWEDQSYNTAMSIVRTQKKKNTKTEMELQSRALRDGIVMCRDHSGKWQASYRSHASEPAWVMMLFCRNCVNRCGWVTPDVRQERCSINNVSVVWWTGIRRRACIASLCVGRHVDRVEKVPGGEFVLDLVSVQG